MQNQIYPCLQAFRLRLALGDRAYNAVRGPRTIVGNEIWEDLYRLADNGDVITNLARQASATTIASAEIPIEDRDLELPEGVPVVGEVGTQTCEEERDLGVVLEPRDIGVKQQYGFKGLKSSHISAGLPNQEEDEKPYFINEGRKMKPKLTISEKFERWLDRVLGGSDGVYGSKDFETDQDLVFYLRSASAFAKRTPALLLTLKQKAIKWMEQFDRRLISQEDQYKIVMRAVAQAFVEDHEQYKVRWLLGLSKTVEATKSLNHFLNGGLWATSVNRNPTISTEYVLFM